MPSKNESTPTRGAIATRYSVRGVNLFLTWPQCETAKEIIGEKLKKVIGCKYVVVAQETHADGNHHLHAVLSLKKRMYIKHSVLDACGGKHGNYKSCRSLVHCMKYLKKEDDKPYTFNVDLDQWLKEHKLKIAHKGNEAKRILLGGGSLDDILKEGELWGYALTNKRKIEEMAGYLAAKSYTAELQWEEAQPYLTSELLNEQNAEIASWLSKNVKRDRRFKQAQLWIRGPNNVGKTSLIRYLRKYLNIYEIPTHNNHEDWQDNVYDFAYIDEFKGEKSIVWWNKWLDGSNFNMNARYHVNIKKHNVPTIIFSNFLPQQLYPKQLGVEMNSLLCRLKVIMVTSMINIFPYEAPRE